MSRALECAALLAGMGVVWGAPPAARRRRRRAEAPLSPEDARTVEWVRHVARDEPTPAAFTAARVKLAALLDAVTTPPLTGPGYASGPFTPWADDRFVAAVLDARAVAS